jgi:hypothetical protein
LISDVSLTGAIRRNSLRPGTCITTLAPGAACTVTLTFAPVASGRTAMLAIADSAAGSPQFVSLNGTGTGVSITLRVSVLTHHHDNLRTGQNLS